MKRHTKLIICQALCLLLVGLFTSCGKASIGNGEDIPCDSIVADTTAAVIDKANAPQCKIHINFKYLRGAKVQVVTDSLLRSGLLVPDYLSLLPKKLSVHQALHHFMAQYVNDYQRDGQLILGEEPANDGLNWEYSVATSMKRYREGIIAYIGKIHTNEGGRHAIDQTVVRNIREKDGRILSVNDLLVPGYAQTLLEKVVEALADQFDTDGLEGLQSKNIFQGIEPYLPDNFIWGDGAIMFIYQCDEIAPHDMGEIAVTVRLKDKYTKTNNE